MLPSGSFSQQLTRWVDGSVEDINELHQAIIIDLFSSVIEETPVLEGRLAGNWIISSDNPASGTFELLDPSGNITKGKVQDHVSKIEGNFDVYLTNNLPYAYRIEYDGWSGKAPNGMVRKNYIRVLNNLKRRKDFKPR